MNNAVEVVVRDGTCADCRRSGCWAANRHNALRLIDVHVRGLGCVDQPHAAIRGDQGIVGFWNRHGPGDVVDCDDVGRAALAADHCQAAGADAELGIRIQQRGNRLGGAQLQLGRRDRAYRALRLGDQERPTDALHSDVGATRGLGIDLGNDSTGKAVDQNGVATDLVEEPTGCRAGSERRWTNAVAVDDGNYRGGSKDGAERGVTHRPPAHLL